MDNEINNYEIVRFVDGSFELEVNVSPSEETVWLTKNEIASLFNRDRSVISRHIQNIFNELECERKSNVRFLHIANSDKPVEFYNLDVIISVGYRVKSQRGVIFRKWANSVLKQYMLKGYAIDPTRVLVTQENYLDLVNVVNRIDCTQEQLASRVERLETKYNETGNRVFFKGQMWDATSCIEEIIRKAGKKVILIDGYVDKGTLDMLSRKREGVAAEIYTSSGNFRLTENEINAFESQYGKLKIGFTDEFHDRFLILDNELLFHIGASIKDAGKKAFGISVISDKEYLKNILARVSTPL